MTKTDYYGIHENQYKYLKNSGREGWNDEKNIVSLYDLVLKAAEFCKTDKPKVLELGCGDGQLAVMLAEKGFDVTGIDISPTAVEWAKERTDKAKFIVGDVLDTGFKSDSFDIIIDSYCLHCIIGEDRKKMLSEVKRLLKCGGLFAGITMSNTIPEDIKQFFNEKREMVKNGIAGRYIGRADDILNEFSQAGFEIIENTVDVIVNEADDLKYICRK
ncbi:MAG TPA: class I SAM-dependent methyltransferase [Clostridiales bacterium]|nr:class I SAM-dependent methyltransferase [Clostridiales bacterium]